MSSRVIFFRFPCFVSTNADFVIVTADVLIQSTNSLTASRATITAPLCFISRLIGDHEIYSAIKIFNPPLVNYLSYFPYMLLF